MLFVLCVDADAICKQNFVLLCDAVVNVDKVKLALAFYPRDAMGRDMKT